MTFSILARDPASGEVGGAAATGSLCVGGWVLRAHPRAGASASQGAAPSTFWGEDVLVRMRAGEAAAQALSAVTGSDAGREHRQLAAIGLDGATGHFTGAANTPAMGARVAPGVVVTGNLLTGEAVLDAALEAFRAAPGALPDRLLAALEAGARAGGDKRGLQSAALLVVGPAAPPLTLRIDWSETPLADLARLRARAARPPYADWLSSVPVLTDRERPGPE